jgi:TPP-dependent indolepyruvate ferredoxin oxidoreductase alpha subunit
MKRPDPSAGKRLLSGNEAIALGAWEAGVRYAAAYPGTPSTEILPALAQYAGVYAEWASNEKVALDAAVGASFAGARALAAMKHVGVNVASDSLMTLSYTGVGAGLVWFQNLDPVRTDFSWWLQRGAMVCASPSPATVPNATRYRAAKGITP